MLSRTLHLFEVTVAFMKIIRMMGSFEVVTAFWLGRDIPF